MSAAPDMRRVQRSSLWLILLAVLAAGCADPGSSGSSGSGGSGSGSGSGPDSVTVTQLPASPEEDVESGIENPDADGLPEPLVDVDRLISGGPPPDGIPSINEPKFDKASAVDFLEPDEPVLALEIDGIRRAYPVQILIWHEIVNDTLGDVPVAVTYCPLCNSALAFDRRAADRVLSFGVSGLLYNSDLVMFDRQTRSIWPQLEGQAVAGVLTGTELTAYPIQTLPWQQWLDANPDGLVLNRDTGSSRDYGQNPYVAYDEPDSDPFLLDVEADGRLPAKTRVVGLGDGGDAVAVVTERLLKAGTKALSVGSEPVVLFAKKGLTSALDRATVAGGRDVGVTGAFSPIVKDKELTFSRQDGAFVDAETGTQWSITGAATAGELAGEQLAPVQLVDTFWFAWALFQTDTTIAD